MKRLVLLAALVALPGSLLADSSSQRYLVATRHAAHGVITKDPADTPRGENVRIFSTLDAYAADLTDAEVAALRKSKGVLYVEPVVERHAFDLDPQAVLPVQTTPYGISLVRAPETWPVVTGQGINVVVIDTGIDYRHSELKDIYMGGLNTFTGSNDPFDDNGHGTHCAGIIAAANNAQGVVGVAHGIRLWSVKVLDKTGSGSTENVVTALDWVITQKNANGGNWIVSLSLGSDKGSTLERTAFSRALDNGILAVAASGNESTSNAVAPVAFPAAYSGIMAVGAVDSGSSIATFSNQGVELSVVAPGVSILSTVPIRQTYSAAGVVTSKGTISASPLTGSDAGTISGNYVYCDLGRVGDFPPSVAGNIALIKRGDITFREKAKNAMDAGATSVVIFNKDSSALTFTLIRECTEAGDCTDHDLDLKIEWPIVLAITQNDGEALAASTSFGRLTVTAVADEYGSKSGTSMATPHVAGVAALVWSAAPDAPPAAVKNAIEQTAADRGAAGRDTVFGFGVVDALSAAKQLAPQKFGTGATPNPPTGRTFLKRGGH